VYYLYRDMVPIGRVLCIIYIGIWCLLAGSYVFCRRGCVAYWQGPMYYLYGAMVPTGRVLCIIYMGLCCLLAGSYVLSIWGCVAYWQGPVYFCKQVYSPELKQSGLKADHSSVSPTEVKNAW
jgi:hypothetical protein